MDSNTKHDVESAIRAHRRLLETVQGLDDDIARRPSVLPGWNISMLLTHIARNADGHTFVCEGAAIGESRKRYPNQAVRDAAIEAGRHTSTRELVEDVRTSTEKLERAWAALPEAGWSVVGQSATDEPEPLAKLPGSRLREVEIHHTDLGLSFTYNDWEAGFVEQELERWAPIAAERLSGASAIMTATDLGRTWTSGSPEGALRVEAPSRQLLAWLLGRVKVGFPEIEAWR